MSGPRAISASFALIARIGSTVDDGGLRRLGFANPTKREKNAIGCVPECPGVHSCPPSL